MALFLLGFGSGILLTLGVVWLVVAYGEWIGWDVHVTEHVSHLRGPFSR